MINFNIDLSEVLKALDNVETAMEDNAEAYKELSTDMLNDIRGHFAEGISPEGDWKNKKDGTRSYLTRSGVLKASIKANPLADRAQVYSETPYTARHNFGGPPGKPGVANMPKREFMWLKQSVIDKFKLKYENRLKKAWTK